MSGNVLYYGDNLKILRQHVADESVDLIYLDPPFKSNQDYNILFAEKDGSRAAAQIKAFEDTWEWNQQSALAYQEIVESGGKVSQVMRAFYTFLSGNDMMAYLSMMAPRLVELRRVLKQTGSIYLHCDPAASHYLKMLMDAIFGPVSFRNEIIWKRTTSHVAARQFGSVHDTLLFYSKSNSSVWNQLFQPYGQEYLNTKYKHKDERGIYRLDNLTGAGVTKGDSGRSWKGFDPSKIGRHWAVPCVESVAGLEKTSRLSTQEKLDILDSIGFIYWTPKGKRGGVGFPQFKRYLASGMPIQDVIIDIPPINSQAQERLHYPTQKPEALLERIINASSNENDTVLDPFCGCGTTIAVAQKFNRSWIGIDITHLAVGLIKHRLHNAYGGKVEYEVRGEPEALPDAEQLAKDDPYEFQWWAAGLVGGRIDRKKGADQGIDGRIFFHERPSETKEIILSVKSGKIPANHIREIRGVIEREKAAIGVLLTLREPTKPMLAEAATAGHYSSDMGTKHPRIQIITIEELLQGKGVDYPRGSVTATFKKAPRIRSKVEQQQRMPFD